MMQIVHSLSASEIAARLAERMPALCCELLPAGQRYGAEWRVGSVAGEHGQSLAVRVSGTKKGVWCDFAAGEGGDALGLVKAVLGLRTRPAMAWAMKWLGLNGAAPPYRQARRRGTNSEGVACDRSGTGGTGVDHDRNTRVALAIWRESRPVTGTLAHAYLQHRGITIPPPPSLRYHPGLRHGPTALDFPGLVAAVQAPDRPITAVHRTFLTLDGRGKARVSHPKMALGPIRHGAVRLAAPHAVLGLAEGIETALSAMELFRIPCWCALGSRVDQVAVPRAVQRIVVFGDNDAAGLKAARMAAAAFGDRGLRVSLKYPPPEHGDWNDALAAERRSAA